MQLAVLAWHLDPDQPGFEMPIKSVEELDKQLDALAKQFQSDRPIVVEVFRPVGDCIGIGIGEPVWVKGDEEGVEVNLPYPITVLSYVGYNGEPPYLLSSGNQPLDCNPVFFYGGHFSEFPAAAVIELSRGREALRRFISSPGLPQNVQWA